MYCMWNNTIKGIITCSKTWIKYLYSWIAELTIFGSHLDRDRAFITSKGLVEKVDFTGHLCIYDHIMLHCAITVYQQITGGVLHSCCYSAQVRDNRCVRWRPSSQWIELVISYVTHPFLTWSSGVQTLFTGRTTVSYVYIYIYGKLMCSIPSQDLSMSAVSKNKTYSISSFLSI